MAITATSPPIHNASTTSGSSSAGQVMIGTKEKDHIVIFPFMAKGHTIPLIHLAAALSFSNLRVTIVTTPANAPFLRRSLPLELHPTVSLLLLPFPPSPYLPPGCESTDTLPSFDLHPLFVGATALLKQPFEDLLHTLMRSRPPPLCLVSDFFLWWTLDVCRAVGLPRVVFHGMSTFSMAICKFLWAHPSHVPDHSEGPFRLPGTPPTLQLTRHVIPDAFLGMKKDDPLDPATQFLEQLSDSDTRSWGVLVNSISDIDGSDYVRLFESFYRNEDARAWLVGPLPLLSESLRNVSGAEGELDECIGWLNGREKGSVVYVSFGTQAEVPSEQLDEVAYGLEGSGYGYIWAVRSETWSPPNEKSTTTTKGLIVRWAPQVEVLRHEATGGFLSHCGWNSVLEGVSAGVPLLTWPMIAEQHLNAKHVVEELGVGIRLLGISSREDVTSGVRELMGGEKGREARERVRGLSDKAKLAVAEGGSSRRTLAEFVEKLRKTQQQQQQQQQLGKSAGQEVMLKKEMVEVEEQQEKFHLPYQFRDDGIA